MLLVGLTGGVATGKSTVARLFAECGAIVLDADQLAREVVRPGTPAWRDIVRTFGREVLLPDRTLDRRKLGALVFRDPAKLARLNRIVHPRVARLQARRTAAIARDAPDAVVIYDVPLLFEAGLHHRMDRTIVVAADQATQVARLSRRNGLPRAEALRRIRAQMPLARKRALADHVLDGTRPLPQLRETVQRLYRTLQLEAAGLGRRPARRPRAGTRRSVLASTSCGTSSSSARDRRGLPQRSTRPGRTSRRSSSKASRPGGN